VPKSTDKSDPNELQPLPLPDDQRPQQELNLPPLPVLPKREPLPSPIQPSNEATIPDESKLSADPVLRPSNAQRRMVSSLRTPPPPPQSQSQSSDSDVDHVAMVFTEDELTKIQQVMFKPKTINKRREAADSAEPSVVYIDDNTRVFPVSEKFHSTVVQKEENSSDLITTSSSDQPPGSSSS
jgi:hypothetical protein